MSVQDIEKMYKAMYDSRVQEFEKAKNKSLTDLQATEEENKNTFYNQRNDVAYNSAKNSQSIRDYMAKNNLLNSGESVDALLRNNTDYSNRMGTVDTNEGKFKNDISRQRNLVNSDYENNILGARSQIDSEKAKALYDYNEQIRREQWEAEQQRIAWERQQQLAAQQAAYKASSSGSGSKVSETRSKNDLKAEFEYYMKGKDNWKARDFLQNGKEEIVNQYGIAFYKQLEDMYWNDMGNYYSPKR